MREGGVARFATVEIHPQTFQSFSSSPCLSLFPGLSLNRTAYCDISAHIRAWTHTESCVCARVWIDQALPNTLQAALADRLKLEGEMTKKKKKKKGGTRLPWKKKKKKKPKKAKYYFALVFTLEDDIYILFVVSTKQIGPVTWCNIKAINLYPGCLKQRPGHFVIMKKKKKKEKKLPAVISWLLKLPVGRW